MSVAGVWRSQPRSGWIPRRSESSPVDLLRASGAGAIEEYAEFVPAGAPKAAVAQLYQGKTPMVSGDEGDKIKFAFGAEFVEVRINARTREIRVPRIVGAFAAGRIMNTRTARSQLMGGMIWGISCALHEKTEIDEKAARYVTHRRLFPMMYRAMKLETATSTLASARPLELFSPGSADPPRPRRAYPGAQRPVRRPGRDLRSAPRWFGGGNTRRAADAGAHHW